MRQQIMQFIAKWNQQAHPFHWSTKSVAKVMADAKALSHRLHNIVPHFAWSYTERLSEKC
jgi:hypothetical protein